ncbi:MAG TPA: hypothetical protein VGK14_13270 [Novimethylophilus sp.]|jgi:hypothetical protein|uniref:hypothetical protein n=1 Tax=Novimethylophilus sp. TaxID=2137426 RepID=UPI002F42FBA4
MIQENIITNIKLQIELEEGFAKARANNSNGMPDSEMIGHHRHALAEAQRNGDAALVERHSAALMLLQAN